MVEVGYNSGQNINISNFKFYLFIYFILFIYLYLFIYIFLFIFILFFIYFLHLSWRQKLKKKGWKKKTKLMAWKTSKNCTYEEEEEPELKKNKILVIWTNKTCWWE
jgi:hypothetical protein